MNAHTHNTITINKFTKNIPTDNHPCYNLKIETCPKLGHKATETTLSSGKNKDREISQLFNKNNHTIHSSRIHLYTIYPFTTYILSLLLFTCIPVLLFAKQNNTKTKHASEATCSNPINTADHLVEIAQQQLSTITQLLTELSLMIGNQQITTLKNKQDALVHIQELISLTQSIQQEKCINADENTAYALLSINRAIIKHVTRMTQGGLKTFTQFDLAKNITRVRQPEQIHISMLTTLIEKNKKALKTLSQQTDTIGLQWYNHLYRAIDSYIIDPAQKYNVPSRLAALSALSCLGMYFYWKCNGPAVGYADDDGNEGASDNWLPFGFHDPIIFGKRFFGPILPMSPNGAIHANLPQNALGWLGRAELEATSLSLGHLFIGGALLSYTWNSFKHDVAHYTGKAAKKIAMWHNYLKGGAFINRARKLDENFIEDVYFDDIIGLDQVKATFKLLVHYLENPEAYDRLGLTPGKGILLVGETRTGKTFSVKALANEIRRMCKRTNNKNAQFKYIQFNASEINQEGIKYWLNIVKAVAPCVVFIDEIDLLDLQRRGRNQMLSEFLTSMSGTLESKDPKNQIILIAATNRPESLDIALRQAGRFGTELRFELPSLQNRKELITNRLNKLSLDSKAFNLDALAHQLEGKSYEDIHAVINLALLKARLAQQILSQSHLEHAIDELIRRITIQPDKQVNEQETKLIATHFAGHALYLYLTDMPLKMATVTVHPVMTAIKEELIGTHLIQQESATQDRYQYGELFTQHHADTLHIYTREQQLQLCQYHLAGLVAEEIMYGSSGHSCHKKDMSEALKIAQLLAFEGLEAQKLPEHLQKEKYDTAMHIIDTCKSAVHVLFAEHRAQLETLIQELRDRKQLYPHDIHDIIGNEQDTHNMSSNNSSTDYDANDSVGTDTIDTGHDTHTMIGENVDTNTLISTEHGAYTAIDNSHDTRTVINTNDDTRNIIDTDH